MLYWYDLKLVKGFRCNYISGSADLLSILILLCSSIDMCGFGIYVSGFVPVCIVRSIFRWFDCDLCKLDSFAFGSIYF